MGSDLGGAMKGFKEGMRSEPEVANDDIHKQVEQSGQTIEGEVKDKTHTNA
jgi:sec-independent protein translocase protein TatA